MNVYLAGPISGLAWGEATDWRHYAIDILKKYGITGWNPIRGKHYLQHETSIADSYETNPMSSSKGITTRDRWDCTRSDIVLANFTEAEKVSIGTVMEVAWADAARVPVIAAMKPGNLHDHAMVREAAGFIVPDLDSALRVAISMLSHEIIDWTQVEL